MPKPDTTRSSRQHAALLILFVLALVVTTPTGGHSQETGYWYTHDKCEFSVKFPHRPNFRTLHPPGGQKSQEVSLSIGNTMLKAECSDFGGIWDGVTAKASDEDWIGWMASFMEAEGMTHPQIGVDENLSLFGPVVVDGRAYKTVTGTRVTYRIRLIAGRKSTMFLYTGGPSASFPTREASDFMKNYR